MSENSNHKNFNNINHHSKSASRMAMLAPSQAIRSSSIGNNPPIMTQMTSSTQQQGDNVGDGDNVNRAHKKTPNRRRAGAKKKNFYHEGQPPLGDQRNGTDSSDLVKVGPPKRRRPRRKGIGSNNNTQNQAGSNADTGNDEGESQKKGSITKSNLNQNNSKNQKRQKPKKRYPWRRFLPKGSVDPITLENLQTLEYPPFALCADEPYVPVPVWPVPEQNDDDDKKTTTISQKVLSEPDLEELNRQRVAEQWGTKVLPAPQSDGEDKKPAATSSKPSREIPSPSKRPYNLFDGRALAYYMVSQLQFIDPLNRRDLTRPELVNLDAYLMRHGLYTGDLKVTEAYDAKGITISSAGAAATTAQGRTNIMQQMAQQLLNSLFTGHSTSSQTERNSARSTRHGTEQHQTQSNALQEQYMALQRREQALAQQRQSESPINERGTPFFGDSALYGSIDDHAGGFMVIDDDENPGMRGGIVVLDDNRNAEPSERNDFPSLANDSRGYSSAGAAYSASHIVRRYRVDEMSSSGQQPIVPFPELPRRPESQVALPATSSDTFSVKKGPSKTLTKISGLVKKTDPEERQRQWEAREAARRRAMMSNLTYGINPSMADPSSSLLTPPTPGDDTTNVISEEKIERNRAFAEALGVKPATQRLNVAAWSRPMETKEPVDEFKNELSAAIYPQELIALARERMPLLFKLEKKWEAFLADDKAASLSLYPMDKPGRKLVHHYAEFWDLKTESFDPEPKRYIHCVKLLNTHTPHPLLSNAARSNSSFQVSATINGLTVLSNH